MTEERNCGKEGKEEVMEGGEGVDNGGEDGDGGEGDGGDDDGEGEDDGGDEDGDGGEGDDNEGEGEDDGGDEDGDSGEGDGGNDDGVRKGVKKKVGRMGEDGAKKIRAEGGGEGVGLGVAGDLHAGGSGGTGQGEHNLRDGVLVGLKEIKEGIRMVDHGLGVIIDTLEGTEGENFGGWLVNFLGSIMTVVRGVAAKAGQGAGGGGGGQ